MTNTVIKEPSIKSTGIIYYGILDNESGTLVDRNDNEAGDYSYTTKNLPLDTGGKEVLVVDILSTNSHRKALYTEFDLAQHVKELLSIENPNVSYSVVSFTEKVYTFLEFNVEED